MKVTTQHTGFNPVSILLESQSDLDDFFELLVYIKNTKEKTTTEFKIAHFLMSEFYSLEY